MGLNRHYRLPFNLGLSYQRPVWCSPSVEVEGVVNGFLQASHLKAKKIYSNEGFSGNSVGYLKVILGNAKTYFVKIVPLAYIRPFYFSLNIDAYYKRMKGENGSQVLTFWYGRNKYFAIVDIYYPYKSFDICKYGVGDIVKEVNCFHEIMSAFPDRCRVEKYSKAKLSRLAFKKDRFLGSEDDLNGLKGVISTELHTYNAIKDKIMRSPNKQVIHCDLNVGNLVSYSGSPVFLDFEESPRSFLPPIFDVAKMIERFILVRNDMTDDRKSELISEIMSGLSKVSDRYSEKELSLNDALLWYRQISWLVLAENPALFLDAGSPEVRKFLFLKSLGEKYHHILEGM